MEGFNEIYTKNKCNRTVGMYVEHRFSSTSMATKIVTEEHLNSVNEKKKRS